jgi:hypothetical protein
MTGSTGSGSCAGGMSGKIPSVGKSGIKPCPKRLSDEYVFLLLSATCFNV